MGSQDKLSGLSARARALYGRLQEGRFYPAHADRLPKAMYELEDAGLVKLMARPELITVCWVPKGSVRFRDEVIQ